MISLHTVFIILGQYIASHILIQIHHIANIQKGIVTLHDIVQFITASYIAAIGQIAFATSFAQCANDKSQTAAISGIVKSKFTDSLLFFILVVFNNLIFVISHTIIAKANQIKQAYSKLIFLKNEIFFNHFTIK